MRARTVLILLVLVVGLVAFIELYEHELPSSEERAELEKLVLTIEPSEVTAVELSWDGHRVLLERQLTDSNGRGGEEDLESSMWRIAEPMSARADSALVVPLIESLTSLEKKRTLEGMSPDEVGLSPPRLSATLYSGDLPSGLLVGSEVPVGNAMIVSSTESDEFFVVDDLIWSELTRAPGDWRSRTVFEVGQEMVTRVVLERAEQRVVLARKGPEFWLEEPVADLADPEKAGNLLTALATMQVTSFLDEPIPDLADLGLAPPGGVVELNVEGDDDVFKVEWGGEVPESETLQYARANHQIFSTEADLEPQFAMSVEQWRSLDLTSLETFQIDDLEIAQSGLDDLHLVRDGANWKRNEDEISFTSVSELLYALTGAQATGLVAESKSKVANLRGFEPELQVLLRGSSSEQSVSFFSLPGEGAQAVVSNRDVVLFVEHDEFTEILENVSKIRAADSVKKPVDE